MFCVSSFIQGSDAAYGAMPPERLELLYNGVDLGRAASGASRGAEFRQRHAIPSDRVLVVQAGTMRQEKGVPDLLYAAERVLAAGAEVHFLLAGDGPQRAEFEQLAERLGISARVTFTGRVRDPLGEGLWAASDIACQVSRWQEAFGLTIAEAMAAGKPLIGTRTGAIPELIDEGKSGLLVEPGDTLALAEKIISLARDARRRCEMGQIGKRICHEKFDLQKNVAALIEHYGLADEASSTNGGK
jgi:glycosyltransferase involved in cell wall biosynthesis